MALLFSLSGCVKEVNHPQEDLHEVVFHAGWAPETKTVLQEDGSVWWSPGDEISMFVGDGDNGGYKLTSTNEKPSAITDFIGSIGDNSTGASYIAIYPYSKSNYVSGNTIHAEIPAVQVAKEGTFEKDLFVSAAYSEDDNLFFRNVCSGIKFSVKTSGINKIEIFNRGSQCITGGFDINISSGLTAYNRTGTCGLTIISPDESGFTPNSYYYAVLLPIKKETSTDGMPPCGFIVKYYNVKGEVAQYECDPIEFKQGVFKRMINKDDGLMFYKQYESVAYISQFTVLPDGFDKSLITRAYFHVLSDKTTDVLLSDNGAPIYFEMVGSEAHYYTSAEVYDVGEFGVNHLFKNWTSLKTLDLSDFVTNKATQFFGTFSGCMSLESLDVSGFDTSNATDMSEMFSGCSSLKSLDLSSFNTEKVTIMRDMFGKTYLGHSAFQSCCSLESLDLSNFNVSHVIDMSYMFNYCRSLKDVNLSGWDTSNVENMSGMFVGCSSLEYIDVSSLDTRKVKNMSEMFSGCDNIKTIDISQFNTNNVENMLNIFCQCSSLRSVNLSGISFGSITDAGCGGMFQQCYKLKSIDFGTSDLSAVPKWSFFEAARNSKACAIRCTDKTRDVIINSDSLIESDFFTWVKPNEKIPDLPDVVEPNYYYSSDFSRDGEVVKIQQASLGRGVDIVLIGDAYSDRLIKDGTYEKDIRETMEAIFSVEPYKSFRDLFNVYMVIAVSANEVAEGETALNFRQETIPGNENQILGYTSAVVNNKSKSDIAVVVISHDEHCLSGSGASGKTLLQYSVGSAEEPVDFGQVDLAFSYVPKYSDSHFFRYIVSHEFGHCFAKLADEYIVYDGTPYNEAESMAMSFLGIKRNIDFVSDKSQIKWNKFLNDSRYDDTGIGVYEGGFYSKGAWRPSKESVMNDSFEAGFNAPSREAIYNRIHKLAYGYNWQYDYEEFVKYDAPNIEADIQFNKTNSKSKLYSRPIRYKSNIEIKKNITSEGKEYITIVME